MYGPSGGAQGRLPATARIDAARWRRWWRHQPLSRELLGRSRAGRLRGEAAAEVIATGNTRMDGLALPLPLPDGIARDDVVL